MTTLIGARRLKGKARGASGKQRIDGAIKSVRRALAAIWIEQEGRWGLWIPIAMIAGAATWLTAPLEPPVWWGPAAAVVGGVAAYLTARAGCRAAMVVAAMFVVVCSAGVGASAAAFRTAMVASPRLSSEIGPVRVEGWVMDASAGASRPRVDLLLSSLDGDKPTVRRVRVSVPAAHAPGRAIACVAILRPPEGPLAPRGYDGARRDYFLGLGGSGFALGRCRPIALEPPPRAADRAFLQLAAWRRDLTETVAAAAGGEGGAIAAALVTGDRSLMSTETAKAFQDSGLAHMLSVSGLHMGIVAGGAYAIAHFALALIAPLALRAPIRKFAAVAALLVGAAYLLISGVSVPAQRAFIMTAVALGAVLADRPAFTLRALATAAVLVVLIQPESVVDPGFQMSFAATAALIAAFEVRPKVEGPAFAPGFLLGGVDRMWKALSAMLLASVVAGLATDPFALFHFQRVSVYGLPANLATTPIVSFIVAPAGALAALLAPFGLAEAPLAVMGRALELVRAVGVVFGDRPEAVRALPLMSTPAFLLLTGAVAWGCLWRGALRWGAILLFAAGATVYVREPKPVLLADGDLRAVVSVTTADWIADADPRRGAFARGRLASLAGIAQAESAALPTPADCQSAHCRWRLPSGRLVFSVREPEGITAACAAGSIVLSRVPLPQDFTSRCKPALASDPADRLRFGGLMVYETKDGMRVRRAGDSSLRRAWSGALTRIDE